MATINVITVCGSGTVSSTMLAVGVTEFLEGKGYDVNAVETMPNALENVVSSGDWDFIVTSTSLDENYGLPVVDGLNFLTGVGVEQFEEDVMKVFEKLKK